VICESGLDLGVGNTLRFVSHAYILRPVLSLYMHHFGSCFFQIHRILTF
jgi:hypothetical protein